MSDQQDLTQLTVKDLRQLAAEHDIPNRSKLAKQALIDALAAIADGKQSSAAEPEVLSPESVAAIASDEPEVLSPETINADPEVLDPASVGADQSDPADGSDDSADDTSDGDGDAEGDDKPKRKRRRRRRRRKKSSDGEQGQDEQSAEPTTADSEAPQQDDAAAEPTSESEATTETPREERKPRQQRPQRQRGPAKPRLNGPQRKLPAVLDRLQAFTQGILELCDPETPSWAQARLAELLAEAGLVAIPCEGTPHPDFHTIVGEVDDSSVPAGHIAVIEAPGFALRGDRGDLFPLRPAQVRIAAGGATTDDTAEAVTREDEPTAPTSDGDEPAAPVESSDEPAPVADDDGADDADTAPVPSVEDAVQDDDAEAAPRRRRRRGRGRSRESSDKESDTSADADDSTAAEPDTYGSVDDEPEPKATPRTTRALPQNEAPELPLKTQDPDVLADRAKSAAFSELGLNDQISADLAAIGYEAPTPIQAGVIRAAVAGKDLIGQAQTGTGKTAAFSLPIIQRLYEWEGRGPVALILAPTRELARQVHAEFTRMAGESGARAALIYGGVSMDDQFTQLARHPHVIIGTPGRIIDHMKRRTLDLSALKVLVLDEGDQMLDIGFLPDIEWVMRHTPPQRQTLVFSATMPNEIRKLIDTYATDPEHIHIAPERVTADKVDQKWIAVDFDKKTKLLAHFIETFEPEQMVVFCRTKAACDRVAAVLKRKKMSCGAIHGDLPQSKREKTLAGFRDGSLPCMIATNVAARGIDIPTVSHVVNYDIPENPEDYVHRVGRTARMGRTGIARTFITPEDGQFLLEIEKHIGMLLEEEVIDGMQTTTADKAKKRTIASTATKGPRLLKPLAGGIRLGRRRR